MPTGNGGYLWGVGQAVFLTSCISAPGFLHLGTTDRLDQIIFRCGMLPFASLVFNSISGLHLLDTSSISPAGAGDRLQTLPNVLREGKITPS